ncbi:hypothetical protein ZWY2020_034496 [Hordeum vulgare]|nr:hypothetical protein ZWY2020_034496 [Hordeum vulgare]
MSQLEVGPARVNAWRASFTRARANIALSFAMSWHPVLDLGFLVACLEEMEADLAAATYPQATRAGDDALLPEDDYTLALGDLEGITGETDDEETGSRAAVYADAEEADTGATVGADGTSTI